MEAEDRVGKAEDTEDMGDMGVGVAGRADDVGFPDYPQHAHALNFRRS